MLDVASKAFFQTLASSQTLKRLASRYGMSGRRAFGRRFIAGETVDDAIAAVRDIQANGLLSTLDYLGESVTSLGDADTATREYLHLIDAVDRAGVERNLSLKLTQLGLDVDRAMCVDNLRKILKTADRCGFFVRIDKDFERINALGARIRLVKGAYREPKSVAYQVKSDVDAAFVRLGKRLLTDGV